MKQERLKPYSELQRGDYYRAKSKKECIVLSLQLSKKYSLWDSQVQGMKQ